MRRETDVNDIVGEWLKTYRVELERVRTGMPKLAQSSMTRLAKNKANMVNPEGGECLAAVVQATLNKGKAGADVPDEYSVQLGNRIVQGIRVANKEVLGHPVIEEVGEAPAPAEGQSEGQGRTVRRPTGAEAEDLLARYMEWAYTHPVMPPDNLLGHFTGWGRATWSRTRSRAEERGFKFEGGRGAAIKVLSRPVPVPPAPVSAPVSPEDRMDRIEALLARLLAQGGNHAKGS